MKNAIFILCLLGVLLTQSCKESLVNIDSQTDLSTESLYSVDGVLAFRDMKAFSSFCQNNANITETDRKALETKYSYISIQSTYDDQLQLFDSIVPIHYNGAVGAYLNKDRMVIIKNSLYLFDRTQLKYVSLNVTNINQAKVLLNDANQEDNPLVHVNTIKEISITTKKARVSSGYTVQSSVYNYGNGAHAYSTASLNAKFLFFEDGSRAVQVTFSLKALVDFGKGIAPNICSDVIHAASGNFNMYQPKRYPNPDLLGPYPFSVNIGPQYGYGSLDVVVATFPIGYDAEPRAAAYFEGTGSFSTSHGTCYNGRQNTTSGIMNF